MNTRSSIHTAQTYKLLSRRVERDNIIRFIVGQLDVGFQFL